MIRWLIIFFPLPSFEDYFFIWSGYTVWNGRENFWITLRMDYVLPSRIISEVFVKIVWWRWKISAVKRKQKKKILNSKRVRKGKATLKKAGRIKNESKVEGPFSFFVYNNLEGLQEQQLSINYNNFENNGNLYFKTTHFLDNHFRCENVPEA